MVEIINRVQALSLNYGTITRDSPVRSEHVAFYYQSKRSKSYLFREDYGIHFDQTLTTLI